MTRRKFARAAVPCHECGKVGRRLRELCAECLGYSSNALTEGRWVLDPRRRVMVWRDRSLAMTGGGAFTRGQEHDSGPGGATTPNRGLAGSRGTRPTHA